MTCDWEGCDRQADYAHGTEIFCSLHHPAGRVHIEAKDKRIAELEAERDRLRRVLEGIRDNPRYDRGAVGAFNDCRKIAALALNKADTK